MKSIFVADTIKKIGQKIVLLGWVNTVRNHKNIVFIDLRDRTGIVQVVGGPSFSQLACGDVVEIKGLVKKRPEKLVNPKILTGGIEIEAESFKIISHSEPLPIPIDTKGYEIDEELRLRYRYLDIRRSRMMNNLIKRAQVISYIRSYLTERGFIEIETPLLTKSTPEGARDFVVPSRLQPGKWYALPQSPQQYKQMLMVAGVERYFQIARCFRDEDPRADRAYGEFTQLDIEISFVDQNDILQIAEDLFSKLIKDIFPEKKVQESPWPRITYQEALKKYGSDKPDLRSDPNDKNLLAFCWIIDFPLFVAQKKSDYFYGAGEKLAPSHHMFTAPHPDDIPLLDKDPSKVRGLQHDLVLNGFEIGGGSIRIHDASIQKKVFDIIGFGSNEIKQFSHLLEAFSFGVPPHGGIAPGIDRFLMVVLNEPSVRETIAFPMSSGGKTSVMDAPSKLTQEQLKELHLYSDVKKKT